MCFSQTIQEPNGGVFDYFRGVIPDVNKEKNRVIKYILFCTHMYQMYYSWIFVGTWHKIKGKFINSLKSKIK